MYLVKVVKSVSPDEEITVRADTVMIEDGDLAFFKADDNDNEILTLAISRGDWKTVHKADEQYQFPVSVERWKNVEELAPLKFQFHQKRSLKKKFLLLNRKLKLMTIQKIRSSICYLKLKILHQMKFNTTEE